MKNVEISSRTKQSFSLPNGEACFTRLYKCCRVFTSCLKYHEAI
jgi:hypothetical protein